MIDLRGQYIVETEWLVEHLNAPDLAVVDASLHLPTAKRDPRAEFASEHILGALFFDIDDISDRSSNLPHMLPSAVVFASKMKQLGIGDGTTVVAYDTTGLYSAARGWWMLRAMGHENVAVLNGGLPKWKAEGHPVTDEPTLQHSDLQFTPRFNAALVRDLEEVRAIIRSGDEQIVDARAAGRFRGESPEPREGLRAGHMPGALNVPFSSIQNENGTLKSDEEMCRIFEAAGVDLNKPTTASCGSGVTAAVLALALAVLGQPDVAVYDGAWAEWGHRDSGCDVVT